jgi:predicted enzyme involved in methoxymalonyl-ACP biosynthesis
MWIKDLCISCRALGRGVEDAMVNELVRALKPVPEAMLIKFEWSRGPRNGPALDWLAGHNGSPMAGEEGVVVVEYEELARRADGLPVTVVHRDDTPMAV